MSHSMDIKRCADKAEELRTTWVRENIQPAECARICIQLADGWEQLAAEWVLIDAANSLIASGVQIKGIK